MPKRRANGEGNIRKRKDGRWEGRYTVGHDPETGKAIIKNVLGKTQAEVKEKLKKAIEENVGIDYGRAKTYTVGSWLEVWMENYAKVKLRPSTFKTCTRLSEKPHQAADRQHPAGRPDFSGLTAVLQAPAGRRAGRPHRGQEEAERSGTQNRAEHPPDDRLGVQPRHRAAPCHEKSNAGLRPAESRTQGDENADRRPTQRLLPGGQGQRRVRALLPRPRHRTTAWANCWG